MFIFLPATEEYFNLTNFSKHIFRCLSDKLCNGDVAHINTNDTENSENICYSSIFDVDKIVDHLNNELREGMAEKSR